MENDMTKVAAPSLTLEPVSELILAARSGGIAPKYIFLSIVLSAMESDINWVSCC